MSMLYVSWLIVGVVLLLFVVAIIIFAILDRMRPPYDVGPAVQLPRKKPVVSNDQIELSGREGCVIYRLKYIGGPKDGMVCNSFRPYDTMAESEGVYAADKQGEPCLIYVNDWTRDIELKWRGKNWKRPETAPST